MRMIDHWCNCYKRGWGRELVPEAFAHPAKVSFSLAERIYAHLAEEGWIAEGDTVIEKSGAQVIVDEVSLGILKGSTLDFTEDLSQAGFTIENPNATARCGCGNSFSVSL